MKYFSLDQAKISKSQYRDEAYAIANKINLCQDLNDIQKNDLVLVCSSLQAGKQIRDKVYSFTQHVSIKIHDLGDFEGGEMLDLMTTIKEIFEKEAFCIYISEKKDDNLFHHLHDHGLFKNTTENSCTIARDINDTTRLYEKKSFVQIACQSHRSTPIHLLKSDNLSLLRLGELRNYLPNAEPHLRHSDFCFFDINAVRFSDCPAQDQPSSSGLTSEESCQLMRYAGQAERLKFLWIYGYAAKFDDQLTGADFIAQCIWYLAEGVENRKDKVQPDSHTLTTYVIEFDGMDIPIQFHKSKLTDRWWVELSPSNQSKLIPCSLKDYESAKQGELSDRLIKLLDLYL